jgi:DNA-binding CsgD family transcriptional regulator
MRVGVLCNDPLVWDGLQCLLSGLPGGHMVSTATSASDVEHELKTGALDVVVAADLSSSKSLLSLKRRFDFTAIVFSEDGGSPPGIDHVLDRRLGFQGLRSVLEALGPARPSPASVKEPFAPFGLPRGLTPREREVARLVSTGMPNRSIALTLGIQEQSVKNLVSGVMRKLACENRTQLALQLSSASY